MSTIGEAELALDRVKGAAPTASGTRQQALTCVLVNQIHAHRWRRATPSNHEPKKTAEANGNGKMKNDPIVS